MFTELISGHLKGKSWAYICSEIQQACSWGLLSSRYFLWCWRHCQYHLWHCLSTLSGRMFPSPKFLTVECSFCLWLGWWYWSRYSVFDFWLNRQAARVCGTMTLISVWFFFSYYTLNIALTVQHSITHFLLTIMRMTNSVPRYSSPIFIHPVLALLEEPDSILRAWSSLRKIKGLG